MDVSLLQEPTAEYVEEFSTVIVDGRSEQQVLLPISSGAYIAPGSIFTINITEATLQNLEGLLCYLPFTFISYLYLVIIHQHKKVLDLKYPVQLSW